MVGIVLVNYKNEDEIINYITNELIIISIPYIVVIVDNSCDKKCFNRLKNGLLLKDSSYGVDSNQNIYLIDGKENLGFARANNLGARFLINNFSCSFLLFSNSDITFNYIDPVSSLVNKMNENNNISAINPKIVDFNYVDQSPMRELSIWRMYILRFSLYPFMRKVTPIINNAKEGEYFRLMGCFLLVRTNDFLDVGMFDRKTFLFGEELILCEKIRKINKLNYFFPKEIIFHNQSSTIKNFMSEKKQIKLMANSELYFFEKYKNVNILTILLAWISVYIYIYVYMYFKFILKKNN